MEKAINVNGNVVFKPHVRTYHQPKVVDEYMDDDGENHYVLDNGNTQLKRLYDSLWHPIKSVINWKSKGENPDKTKF